MARLKKSTLANGIVIATEEMPDAYSASLGLWVDVGSRDETAECSGLAHLFEHMAFKGTQIIGTKNYEEEKQVLDRMDLLYNRIQREKYSLRSDTVKLSELSKTFEDLRQEAKALVINNEFIDMFIKEGDQGLNAYTNNDATQYIASLPSNRLEFWMAATSDRFLNPVFREFYKEKDVVMEERRLGLETQPVGKLIEDFMATAFKAHPYHHSTVGHMADLKRITRQDVKDYFENIHDNDDAFSNHHELKRRLS